MHRLFAAIDAPGQGNLAVFGNYPGGIVIGHGQIGIKPVPLHPQPHKILPLNIDKFKGVLPAAPAHLQLRQFRPFFLEFFINLMLDGQAVTVPARHVGAVKAAHLL